MLLPIVLALVLPCAGMGAFFVIYLLLLWCSVRRSGGSGYLEKDGTAKGLSESDLQKLPKSEGVLEGTECAVCLDEIERGQVARLLPACNHTFHIHCADTWLSKKPVCPVCRSTIGIPVKGLPQDC
ncbi:E3 ubiquitin-protein ligase ATL23-like [Magnolia sinica]|uniref:E3 ubiquitin-protein ligase ATL23-like n=1 Tax=Magnolia sinica TaxID=86752 RepID=UPI002659EE64|nr:E3 ubiquitin-protein ligase ATL23-like [Magnolia sinica]